MIAFLLIRARSCEAVRILVVQALSESTRVAVRGGAVFLTVVGGERHS